MQILLINPKNPENFWAMQSSVKAIGAKTLMPNTALATLVSLTPHDINIEYTYCDENVNDIDFSKKYDCVAMTGYTLHEQRIKEISAIFHSKGIPIAIGGALATLYPDRVRDSADFLFIGEGEYTWPEFLRELSSGKPRKLYHQTEFVDLKDSPTPDWSFINGDDYLYFSVQTSRGCPNNCDFCDAIRLVGRRYRTKNIDQIILEVHNAYNAGAETIFFSEDNFFVKRSFTVELLNRLINWNTKLPRPVSFSGQATISIGMDDEILRLLADARFSVLFLGVESLREKCLQEVNKGHLAKFNVEQCINNISSYGIMPFTGFIVGFDNDDDKTFKEIAEFVARTSIPLVTISILNAPEQTRLYNRLKEQNRIYDSFKGGWHFSTNIKPLSIELNKLVSMHNQLFSGFYEPELFEQRITRWLDNIKYTSGLYRPSKTNLNKIIKLIKIIKYYFLHEPFHIFRFLIKILYKTLKNNPRSFKKAITIMIQYCHYYDFSHNVKME